MRTRGKQQQIFRTEVVGCDGCLNPDGMGIDMMEYYNTDKNKFNGPDVTLTNNNGGFQLEFVCISQVINHMTYYNSSAHIGGKFIQKKSSTRFALQSECCNFNQ